MISARLPLEDENGKVTIIVGFTGYELNEMVTHQRPVVLDMTEVGGNANLIFIARPNQSDCIEAVKKAVGGNVEIVDRRPDLRDMLRAALERKTATEVLEIPRRRNKKRR